MKPKTSSKVLKSGLPSLTSALQETSKSTCRLPPQRFIVGQKQCNSVIVKMSSDRLEQVSKQKKESNFIVSKTELKKAAPTTPREQRKVQKVQRLYVSDGSSTSDSISS